MFRLCDAKFMGFSLMQRCQACLLIMVLTIFNKGAYFIYMSIFHKALNSF